MARVLVVGGGVAGATAALEAARLGHEVTLVTKRALGESATRYAQGGIAAVTDPTDSVAAHVEDTLRASAHAASREAVQVLCAAGTERIADLQRGGMRFDADPTGAPALGREGGHTARRILHAGGDATGRVLVATLLERLRASGVGIVENAALADLLRDPLSGRVRGVELIGRTGRVLMEADAVVLATGGAGRLYRHTTNPEISTGDGVAAALRCGAEVRDLEFVQFHPTALAVPGTPLVSEAVRGEGAVLLDEGGRRFMPAEHPDAELAPRDVVARSIARAMREQGGRPVLLDATGIPDLETRFPTVTASVRAGGFDWTREPVPVTPAAHYSMGGIRTDLDGRTSVPGLFAAGECASTGVHGANRLASNSLLEGLVFGHRVAHAVGEEGRAGSWPGPADPPLDSDTSPRWGVPLTAAEAGQLRERVSDIMWERVGLSRDAAGLTSAITDLTALAAGVGTDPHPLDDVPAIEARNLLLLGIRTARAALARTESVGAHLRTDGPAEGRTDPAHRRELATDPRGV